MYLNLGLKDARELQRTPFPITFAVKRGHLRAAAFLPGQAAARSLNFLGKIIAYVLDLILSAVRHSV